MKVGNATALLHLTAIMGIHAAAVADPPAAKLPDPGIYAWRGAGNGLSTK